MASSPEGSYAERFRTSYITCSPTCRFTWYFTVFGFLYLYVATHCAPLLFRLLCQSAALVGFLILMLLLSAFRVLHRNVRAGFPTRQGRILSLKTIPESPVPGMQQKLLAYIQLLELNHDEEAENTNQVQAVESVTAPAVDRSGDDASSIPTVAATDAESPMVLLDPGSGVQPGDILTLSLLNGDETKLLHIPYQVKQTRSYLWKSAIAVSMIVATLLLLHYSMPGIPVMFASSKDLEDFFQSIWFCQWGLDKDEDDDQRIEESLQECCSITPAVGWAYRLCMTVQLAFYIGIWGHIYWRVRNAVNGANGGTYRMLSRGDNEMITAGQQESTVDGQCNAMV